MWSQHHEQPQQALIEKSGTALSYAARLPQEIIW